MNNIALGLACSDKERETNIMAAQSNPDHPLHKNNLPRRKQVKLKINPKTERGDVDLQNLILEQSERIKSLEKQLKAERNKNSKLRFGIDRIRQQTIKLVGPT